MAANNNNSTKTANSFRPTWGNITVVVLLAAAVSGWGMTFGGYSEKVRSLENQLVLLRERLRVVEIWQRDWPSQGELTMDRGQNTRIEELLRRVGHLEQKFNGGKK